ncbi:MAG: Ig-like domain-containing protein, partial [Jatrophihabitans sp.]
MHLRSRRASLVALAAALCLGIGVLVAIVAQSHGYSARHVELNNGGVWVSSDHDGLFGRVNLPVGALDAVTAPPGGAQQNFQLEAAQDGSAILARDRASSQLYPIDPTTGAVLADAGIPFGADEQVSLGGGTLAAFDPTSGKVWAVRYEQSSGLASLAGIGAKAATVAKLPASSSHGGALAVGVDGTVHVLSADDTTATVRQTSGGLGRPAYANLRANLRAPQLTAVGADAVIFDASIGVLLLPGGRTVTLDDRDAAAMVQRPGPAQSRVLIATSDALTGIDLRSGAVHRLFAGGTGAPAVPALVGDCAYAAWVGTPGVAVRSCRGAQATRIALQGQRILIQPQIQTNRGAAVLDDLAAGAVWELRHGHRVDNWKQIKPPSVVKPKPNNKHPSDRVGVASSPPHAVADSLGARPGRTTTLHVLDNDSDPSGSILSITSVSAPDNADADLQIAPDGQSVQIDMPASASSVHFRYTINDTKQLSASAEVTVTARPFGTNRAPNLRPGFKPRVWAVPAGGKLSLPVLGDWRDFDGDPPVLATATATKGTVSTTPDGRLNYIAGLDAGPRTIIYTVTDGVASSRASVDIDVLSVTSAQSQPAVANPDVARGQVGQPIVIRPLDNDLPGADPTNPDAQLQLAAQVAQPDGTDVSTDLKAGTVTVTAARRGTFVLTYSVAFGNAAYAKGSVRVDVTPPAAKTDKPVAVLDTAVLHGQRPIIVDVLANDFDPAGRLLVVESAAPQSANNLEVAIVQGRYLRIDSLEPDLSPNPQIVNYTITDGVSASVTGQVSVSQLPDPAVDTPVPQDDSATVRSLDAVTVPVLDNDIDPSGDILSLAQNVEGAPARGQLVVSGTAGGPGAGDAFVSDNVVRYVAPLVRTERHFTVDYVVQNNAGDQAVGHVFITVEPPPTRAHPDQNPTPPEIDQRTVAGDTLNLPIRTTGSDPDGDGVTLVGIASAPKLGRILATSAGFLRYQAYPTSAGTDSFSYTVTDKYGKTGTAVVRVAIVAPGDPQPPVAADIAVNAGPNTTVSIDVLAHVFHGPDDLVTVSPLARSNDGHVAGRAKLLSPTGPIEITSNPGLTPVVIRYAVQDGLADASYGTITVRSIAGINLPPVAVDAFAVPAAHRTQVSVDPLAKDYDPDHAANAPRGTVRLAHVYDSQASIDNDKIVLPVLTTPQIVPYSIVDGGGATAMAVVFVPARGGGPPLPEADQLIRIGKNATKTVDIGAYVKDPAGKPLSLTTTAELAASPAGGLRVQQQGQTGLVLVAQHGYIGPAAVTFQVTDGTSLTDPKGRLAIVTVPVQIGPETPVLRCPTNQLSVVQGSALSGLDIATLCHVWVANPSDLARLTYEPRWQGGQPNGIQLSGFGTSAVEVTASGAARPGTTGAIAVGVTGQPDARPGVLYVVVRAAQPPSVAPVTIDGLVAGRSRTIDMTSSVTSRLRDRVISIVSISRTSGLAATTATSGAQVTITPSASAHGTIEFAVVVSDVPDRTQTQRQVTGQITLHVLGYPDAPTGVEPGRTVLSHSALLSWNAPANNGVPIDRYEVAWSGGQQTCQASPCVVPKLQNGLPYQFTVRAHNGVGFGQPSGPSPITVPNAVPSAPTGLQTAGAQDGRLTVSWQPAKVDGTPVLHYVLSWPGGHVTVPSTIGTATGLNNDAQTQFQVVAVNKQGAGPAGSVTGQSSGTPQYPAPPATPGQLPAPVLNPTQAGDHQSVEVDLPSIDPNGPGPTTYAVYRSVTGGGQSTLCTTQTRSCTDATVPNDGRTYSYTFTASNATKHVSGQSS